MWSGWWNITISIHTTARVVTKIAVHAGHNPDDFNPHHRTGGDDPYIQQLAELLLDFNPHHRTGGDQNAT